MALGIRHTPRKLTANRPMLLPPVFLRYRLAPARPELDCPSCTHGVNERGEGVGEGPGGSKGVTRTHHVLHTWHFYPHIAV